MSSIYRLEQSAGHTYAPGKAVGFEDLEFTWSHMLKVGTINELLGCFERQRFHVWAKRAWVTCSKKPPSIYVVRDDLVRQTQIPCLSWQSGIDIVGGDPRIQKIAAYSSAVYGDCRWPSLNRESTPPVSQREDVPGGHCNCYFCPKYD